MQNGPTEDDISYGKYIYKRQSLLQVTFLRYQVTFNAAIECIAKLRCNRLLFEEMIKCAFFIRSEQC